MTYLTVKQFKTFSMKSLNFCLKIKFIAVALLVANVLTSSISNAQGGGPPPGLGGPPTWVGQNPILVQDSMKVMNRLYAQEKLFVSQDIHIDGESRMNGNVHMTDLETISEITPTTEIIFILPDGQLKKGTPDQLIEILYKKPDVSFLCETPNPHWASELNKIYSSCPNVFVGIGNDAPAHQLHVTGVNYAQNFLAGVVTSSNDALYNGFTSNTTQNLIQLGVKFGGGTQFYQV